MFSSTIFVSLLSLLAIPFSLACDSCYGPTDLVTHERIVRRMQPDASGAAYGPTRELEWGQINFLQTTDTHGWLEGHIKEQNYGADWGDFVSFTRHMKRKAQRLGVDLLLVDTGEFSDRKDEERRKKMRKTKKKKGEVGVGRLGDKANTPYR
jgi:2',3'-cyclic-nucleotide 2'-phosphodiesterase (5'-nucleotidase family)